MAASDPACSGNTSPASRQRCWPKGAVALAGSQPPERDDPPDSSVRGVIDDLAGRVAPSQPCCARPAGSSCWASLMGVARLFSAVLGSAFGRQVERALRRRCSSTLLRQSRAGYPDAGSGDVISRVTAMSRTCGGLLGFLPFSRPHQNRPGLMRSPCRECWANRPAAAPWQPWGSIRAWLMGGAPVRRPPDDGGQQRRQQEIGLAIFSDLDSGRILSGIQRPFQDLRASETTAGKPFRASANSRLYRDSGPLSLGPHPAAPVSALLGGNFFLDSALLCCCRLRSGGQLESGGRSGASGKILGLAPDPGFVRRLVFFPPTACWAFHLEKHLPDRLGEGLGFSGWRKLWLLKRDAPAVGVSPDFFKPLAAGLAGGARGVVLMAV